MPLSLGGILRDGAAAPAGGWDPLAPTLSPCWAPSRWVLAPSRWVLAPSRWVLAPSQWVMAPFPRVWAQPAQHRGRISPIRAAVPVLPPQPRSPPSPEPSQFPSRLGAVGAHQPRGGHPRRGILARQRAHHGPGGDGHGLAGEPPPRCPCPSAAERTMGALALRDRAYFSKTMPWWGLRRRGWPRALGSIAAGGRAGAGCCVWVLLGLSRAGFVSPCCSVVWCPPVMASWRCSASQHRSSALRAGVRASRPSPPRVVPGSCLGRARGVRWHGAGELPAPGVGWGATRGAPMVSTLGAAGG